MVVMVVVMRLSDGSWRLPGASIRLSGAIGSLILDF